MAEKIYLKSNSKKRKMRRVVKNQGFHNSIPPRATKHPSTAKHKFIAKIQIFKPSFLIFFLHSCSSAQINEAQEIASLIL